MPNPMGDVVRWRAWSRVESTKKYDKISDEKYRNGMYSNMSIA